MKHPAKRGKTGLCVGLVLAMWLSVFCAEGLGQARRQGTPEGVVINEVLASNSQFPRNPQGGADDWVELYNPGAMGVDVGGCYLTDDLSEPMKWRIPSDDSAATTIPARGYLLVWADGDVAASGLHAVFRLDDEGEEIGLFDPDGETLIDGFSFGPQYTDISYGRYPDGAAELRFMIIPSPMTTNVSFNEGFAERPQVDVAGCLCSGPLTVALTTETEGATIYYTLDGSSPFIESRNVPVGAVYTQPIAIPWTTTLRAVAWKPGWRLSPERVERYIFAGPDLRAFRSPLPIVVVDTLGKSVSNRQTPAFGYFLELAESGRASMTGPIDFAGAGAINVRGKSSGGFAKKQYHFETQDGRGHDVDVSIFGMPAESDWVLQGPYSDKSLIRNVLAYQWSNEIGRYAPRTRLVEMFLNTDNSYVGMSDYVGVYVFMEKIKVSPGRVDVARIDPSDAAEPEITGGYIIKKDKYDSDDQTFNTSRGQRLIYQDPNGADLTAAQKNWIRDYFNAFEAALYGPNFRDPNSGYAKYIDVDSFVDHHILVELCKNIDGFRLSTYMHKDRGGRLNMGPAWDYNLSLGNANYNDGRNTSGWYYRVLSDSNYPYWRRLFEDPAFQLRYADRWFALRRDVFATDRMLGVIEGYASLLDEPAARNFQKWRVLGVYVWPNAFVANTYREEIEWLKNWVAQRLVWMDSQIGLELAPAPPALEPPGGHVETGFALAMRASGPVYYTLDGADPRLEVEPLGPAGGTTLVAETAPKRVLVPTAPVDESWRSGGPFDDSAWTLVTGGPGGIGYERSLGYEGFITFDVQDSMYGRQASCFIRIPFLFAGRSGQIGRLVLRVRYDDGFVAYLNGVEVGRRNAVGDLAWDAGADRQHDDTAAMGWESLPMANADGLLRRGTNLLAIHGLNVSTTSSDFLISAELTAEGMAQPDNTGNVEQYVGPITLTESMRVKARALIGGRWSAAGEAVFAVGPVAESLRISEIMYNPDNTGDPNAEYIEFVNIGPETIHLSLVEFTDGVQFTFPSYELPPADRCLVVRDTVAFEARYGEGLPVVGQYAGGLSNAGERVELTDAAGTVIEAFQFDDDWSTLTDGLGFSLTVADPFSTDPNALGESSAWVPSTHPGGSPGSADPAGP